MLLPLTAAALATGTAAWTWRLHRRHPELIWDWDDLDLADLHFPPDFLWGTATAAHQVEGGLSDNNWTWWETQQRRGRSVIHGGDRVGAAADHFRRFQEDLRLMEALGTNSYRFSLPWSRLEPSEGEFDAEAIAHYHRCIDGLLEAGITPMLTLHHFTHPLWFEERGGFADAANIPTFVAFSERMFREYGDKVSLWCTHNELCVVAIMGHLAGIFPPGQRSFDAMGRVMRNLLLSHVRTYEALKALPGGDAAQLGIVKSLFQFDPYHRWNPVDWVGARFCERGWNTRILDFLEHGVWHMHVPGLTRQHEEVPEAAGATDFVGLNYYSQVLFRSLLIPGVHSLPGQRPGSMWTDMPYGLYAEGLYRALVQLGRLGKPVYVTENGVSDSADVLRETWIRRYLYAMSRAIADGVDVRGYYYWSLLDNFEWAEGYSQRFGLYHVDFETQQRTLRTGSRAYVEIIERWRSGAK